MENFVNAENDSDTQSSKQQDKKIKIIAHRGKGPTSKFIKDG